MAVITITIPAPVVTRVNNALGAKFGYQPTINGSANPESLSAFNQRMVREYVKGIVYEYESRAAIEQASATARLAVESEVVLT